MEWSEYKQPKKYFRFCPESIVKHHLRKKKLKKLKTIYEDSIYEHNSKY